RRSRPPGEPRLLLSRRTARCRGGPFAQARVGLAPLTPDAVEQRDSRRRCLGNSGAPAEDEEEQRGAGDRGQPGGDLHYGFQPISARNASSAFSSPTLRSASPSEPAARNCLKRRFTSA